MLVCGLVFITACKKDKNNSPTGRILMAGRWQISESEIVRYMDKDTSINYYSYWRSCEQDDLLLFEADGKGSHNENTDKCPEDNQSDAFTWELQDNDTKLKVVLGGNVLEFEILEITDNRFRLKSDGTVDTNPATIIETHINVN